MLFIKKIQRCLLSRDFLIVFLAFALSVSAGAGVFLYLKKEVVINDDGAFIALKTMKNTVGEALLQAGVEVAAEDYLHPMPDVELKRFKNNEITIKRAVPVTIIADGKEIPVMTYKDTVREVLYDNAVILGEKDRLDGTSLGSSVVRGMQIKVVRVREELYTENIPIPYKVVTRENPHMDKDTEKVAREGKEGIQEKLYKVVLEDGKEIQRELVSEKIALNPVDKIIEIGTVLNHKTARGDVIRYKKVLNMRATAYTASFKDTGKNPGDLGFGITYTGIKAKKGIIAVDPKVIPLHTKVYVEVAGSTPDYGFAVAEDIGSAIKGDLIDLYFDDQETVDKWGCKKVKVYILLDQ